MELMIVSGALVEVDGLLEIPGQVGAFNAPDEVAADRLYQCACRWISKSRQFQLLARLTQATRASGGGAGGGSHVVNMIPPSVDDKRRVNRRLREAVNRELDSLRWESSNSLRALPEACRTNARTLFGAVLRRVQAKRVQLDAEYTLLLSKPSRADVEEAVAELHGDALELPQRVRNAGQLHELARGAGVRSAKAEHTWLRAQDELHDRVPTFANYARYVREYRLALYGPKGAEPEFVSGDIERRISSRRPRARKDDY